MIRRKSKEPESKQEKALAWIEQTELFQRVREDMRTSRIPQDLLQQAANRLRWLALIVTFCLAINLVIHCIAAARFDSYGQQLWELNWVLIAPILVSGLIWYLAGSERIKARHKLTLALVYEVLLAFWFGVILSSMTPTYRFPEHGISEICLVILGFSILVPNPPIRTLIAGLIAASMDPLGYWINDWMGVSVPPPDKVWLAYYWNYICAGVAIIPALILERLAQSLKDARHMGSYRLTKLIGAGGMGEVWRAEHSRLPRPAAVKVIQPSNLANSLRESVKAIARFEIEARATAKLRSQHAIQIYDYGTTTGGTFYYVMELLQGFDLEGLIDEEGPISSERTAHILEQACHALADAHDQGLIHRDVKPGNLFVTRQGREADFVKVLDFGLVRPRHDMEARVLGPSHALDPHHEKDLPAAEVTEPPASEPADDDRHGINLTRHGAVVGTPAYLAPEAWKKDQTMDGRADLYALGCVGFYLLTARLVFDGLSAKEVLHHHAETPPPRPSEHAPGPVDPRLEAIIMSCLAKKVEDRPADAWSLRSQLRSTGLGTSWRERDAERWWAEQP